MFNKINKSSLRLMNLTKQYNRLLIRNLNVFSKGISIKNFSSLAKFDYMDPLKLEDLLTEEEKMVKIKQQISIKYLLYYIILKKPNKRI